MFGGVCLNVGCILLKVLLYMVVVMDEVKVMVVYGIVYSELMVDIN